MARARTSGRSRPLSHPRSLPNGILMPRVKEAASCSEETNTLASPRLLSVCSAPLLQNVSELPRSFCLRKASGSGRKGRWRQCSGRQPCGSRLARQGLWHACTTSVAQGSTKWQAEACVRAWVSQSKQRQQMWQAAATGGSSRQDSKQACMRAEMHSYPGVCACVHAATHDVPTKRQGAACLSRPTCHPCYKNRPMNTESKGQTCTGKVLCARAPC